MRTIIVDDEPAAVAYLTQLLEAHADVEVVGHAGDGLEALGVINQLKPDLVFLDIQMPVIDGFDLLPYLKVEPLIIFVTAHDTYAIKAFEANACDYLLKPVEPERLASSIARARTEQAKLFRLMAIRDQPEGLQKVICQKNKVSHVIWNHQVAWFSKDGRYTQVCLKSGAVYLSDLTIEYLSQEIKDRQFFRVNRSSLVRRDQIQSFQVKNHATGVIVCIDGSEFGISRSRLQAFKRWFRET